jgi:hypothetical protein
VKIKLKMLWRGFLDARMPESSEAGEGKAYKYASSAMKLETNRMLDNITIILGDAKSTCLVAYVDGKWQRGHRGCKVAP